MRLPWRRREEAPVCTPPDCQPSEATLARQRAEIELEKIKAETPAYENLAQRLKEIRERNNFAAAFRHSMSGNVTVPDRPGRT